MKSRYLGIEIGGTKLQFVVGAPERIDALIRRDVSPPEGAAGIRRQMAADLPGLVEKWKPLGVGVGFGGPVDRRIGRIARSHQVEGWSGFDLGSWLTDLTRLPALVENDANLAALGEAHRGAGIGANPMFYITLGSGVGGGLVVDGRIYHGVFPGESEVGHLRLDTNGAILEHRCSGWAIDGKIRQHKAKNPHGLLAQLSHEMDRGESRVLAEAVAAGDAHARTILDDLVDDLCLGLSHVVHLMHPERIVLGGGLSLIGEPLRSAVAKALPRFVMEVFQPGPTVCLAGLRERAVPVGCLIAAADAFPPARPAAPGSAL